MTWIDTPNAVLNIGFAGQELGEALVDVLLGEKDPSGRMPTTVPARYEHSPAYLNYREKTVSCDMEKDST